MKPSEALASNRAAIRHVVESHRARNARVFGSVLRGQDTDSSDLDILIDPTDKIVQARIALDGKLADETWTVERDKNRVGLRRPGALPVISYEAFLKANPSSKVTHPQTPTSAQNCVTTGRNSPIVVGASGVVVIDGKTYTPGQSAECPPTSNNVATHGENSPIVIGGGNVVINKP